MAQLLELIYSESGFRFQHDTTTKENLTYLYVCCQDSSFRKVKSTSKGNRDVRQMDRFTCDSVLRMRPSLDNQTLNLTMKRTNHNPYGDIRLSPAVLSFINARVAEQTPSQIFWELAASDVAGSESAAQHQVYYRWIQANAHLWRHNPDQPTKVCYASSEGCFKPLSNLVLRNMFWKYPRHSHVRVGGNGGTEILCGGAGDGCDFWHK